jgi:uncharacterized membrane protein (UPF0127 family)
MVERVSLRAAEAALWYILIALIVIISLSPMARPAMADSMRRETVVLATSAGSREISAEIAETEQQKQLGLMFRTSLGDMDGMLFVNARPEDVSMWMRNTYIPLDMIFIEPAGRVHRIEANATPFSERIIPSDGAVIGVLELKGGTAAKLGLKAGDRISSPSLNVQR